MAGVIFFVVRHSFSILFGKLSFELDFVAKPVQNTMRFVCIEEDRKFYEFILENRRKLIEQERWNRVAGRYRDTDILNIDYGILFESIEGYAQKKEVDMLFCMDEFWAHGMTTEIARIMNTTRQNIDMFH